MKVETSSFNPIDIAISGMRGQNKRLEDITSAITGTGKARASTGSTGAGALSGAGAESGARGVAIDDLPTNLIKMNVATRAYQANVATLKRYEQMIDATLELLR